MEIDGNLIMTLLMCYATFKIGYWCGCRKGMNYAIDQLQDAANVLKQIGEKVYADANRKV